MDMGALVSPIKNKNKKQELGSSSSSGYPAPDPLSLSCDGVAAPPTSSPDNVALAPHPRLIPSPTVLERSPVTLASRSPAGHRRAVRLASWSEIRRGHPRTTLARLSCSPASASVPKTEAEGGSHFGGLSSGGRPCRGGRRGRRRSAGNGAAEERWEWDGGRAPGMGRRRSTGQPAGVAGGGGTVTLQEGDDVHFFIFPFPFLFYIFYCLIGLTKGPMSLSAGVLVLNAHSALTGGPAMSDLVSIRHKSAISANCNKFQKISWFYAIQT
jgi:hypothetical protein